MDVEALEDCEVSDEENENDDEEFKGITSSKNARFEMIVSPSNEESGTESEESGTESEESGTESEESGTGSEESGTESEGSVQEDKRMKNDKEVVAASKDMSKGIGKESDTESEESGSETEEEKEEKKNDGIEISEDVANASRVSGKEEESVIMDDDEGKRQDQLAIQTDGDIDIATMGNGADDVDESKEDEEESMDQLTAEKKKRDRSISASHDSPKSLKRSKLSSFTSS